jgi:hypothetical protein
MKRFLGDRMLRSMRGTEGNSDFDEATKIRLKRTALQIAAQLPDDREEAVAVVGFVLELVNEYMATRPLLSAVPPDRPRRK